MKTVFTFALALLAAASAWAQTTFTVNNLKYTVTDEIANTVELTGYVTKPEGTLDIPATVSYNSTTYSVTSIGDHAFSSCSALTQVTIPNSITSIGGGTFYGTVLYENADNWTNNVFYIDNCLIEAKTELSGSYEIAAGTRVIADGAFQNCSALTQVTIPNSITSIGDYAFLYCSAITQVNIPDGVTSIGESAFSGCSAITQVTIGSGVTSIGGWAFRNSSALTQITIPNSVGSIGYYAFSGCSALTQVNWDAINCADFVYDNWTFDRCPITTFIFGNQVKHIPAYLCYDMDKLTQITIGNSVTSIGNSAFENCSTLAEMTVLPTVPPTITASTFCNISTQVKVSIPEGSRDAYMADENWKQLLGLSAGELSGNCGANLTWTFTTADSTLTISGTGNMYNYNSANRPWYNFRQGIKNISIPDGVTSIGNSAFTGCSALTQVTWNAINCVDFSYDYNTYPPFFDCPVTDFTFGDQVKHIPAHLCYGMDKLTQITIPESVTSIGDWALYGCQALTEVTWNARKCQDFQKDILLPSKRPFSSSPITKFTFGDQVEHIPAYLCYNMSKLTQVVIPNSVTSIGEWTFSYCYALTDINVESENTTYSSENGVLFNKNKTRLLQYPIGKKETTYTIPNSVINIGERAFYYCDTLAQVIIPNSVIIIGESAFYNCSALTQINIPNNVTSIGDEAFAYCKALTQVTIPNSVTSLGNRAFVSSALTQATIGNGVTSIKEEVFYGCSALMQVTIGNSVTSIGDRAFRDCIALTQMTVLANLPPKTGTDAFLYVSRSIPVYVPAETLSTYWVADVWKEFINLQAMQTDLQMPSMPESISVYGGTLHNPQQLPVSLYDIQGRMVYSGTAATVSQPAGVYVVRCAGASGKVLF